MLYFSPIRLSIWNVAVAPLLLVSLLVLLLAPAVQGESARIISRQLHFERINELQELSAKTLTCGLQDRYGFLWFGSEDGLIRYDGYTFKEYIFNPADPRSLASNLVYALTEDKQGDIWVGTVGGGLNRYDRRRDAFTRYQHDPANPQSLSHNGVVSLLADSKGNLWIGTEGGGLNRLGPDREKFVRYKNDPGDEKSLANDTIWNLHEDSKHRLWVGTFGGGLDLYQPDSDSFSHFRHQDGNPESLPSNTIGAIFEDRKGRIWVGSTNAGLSLFDPESGRAIRYSYDPDHPGGISHNHVWDIHEDENGLFWLTSFGGGLMLFDPATGKASTYRHNPAVGSSLSNDLVWFIMESRDDIIWIGTDGGGLNKLIKRARSFNYLRTDPSRSLSLSYNGITGVVEGEKGLLWLANDGGGFQRLDLGGTTSRLFRHEPDNPNSLVSDLAEAILVDRLGTVWIGTYNGLSAYNPKTSMFQTYLHNPDNVNSLSDNRIWGLMEDSNGNLWVGTRKGLNRFSPDRKTITRITHQGDRPESLSDNGIWTIFEDSHHAIWVGTDKGLNRMWPDGQGFDHFFSVQDDAASLSHNNITALYEDRKGNLWVGTNGGLNKLAPGGNRFSRFTVDNGLGSNSIRSIMEDDREILWVTTVKGLTRFNPQANTFENFDQSDGLQGSEFSRAHCRTSSGEMVIGGRDGINIFKPEEIVRNTHIPPVVITAIKNQGGSSLLPYLDDHQPIQLDYTDNTIIFEFTALDYSNPPHNSYAYMLEGFDHDWVSIGNLRTATYTNLDGGKYRFRVKGANNHNIWNNEGTSVEMVVAAPPWKRWWAYCLYLLLASGIVWSLVAFKASQHRKRLTAVQLINKELQHEIADRHKAEKALLESEKRLSMALEASQQGIWEFYPQEGTTYYSDTWFTMLGYAPGEFPNNYETWASLLHPEDRGPTEKFVQQLLAHKGDSFNLEFRMLAKDGSYRWILGAGKTFSRDPEGNITHMSGVHLNITERKRAEEEREKLQTQLIQAQKMDSIGRLAGGVAHDFNNMLSVIIGHTQLAMLTLDESHQLFQRLTDIQEAADRATELTRQLLAFARKQTITLQVLDLNKTVEGMLNMLRRLIGENITLSWFPGKDLASIKMDPSQIDQILVNLCVNARDAITGTGKIIIQTDSVSLDEAYCSRHTGFVQGDYVQLIVSDTGCGMDANTLSLLFEPFYTTKETGKGTGLGMAMVYGIVKQNNGFINVYSEPDKGTSFRLYFPQCSGQADLQVDKVWHDAPSSGNETILLVEDGAMILDITRTMLETQGYTVLAAASPGEAISLAKEHGGEIDLLLTDVIMPEMNGRDLSRHILDYYPNIKRMFMSGYTADIIAHHGVLDDGVHFIQKPFSMKDLGAKLREALKG